MTYDSGVDLKKSDRHNQDAATCGVEDPNRISSGGGPSLSSEQFVSLFVRNQASIFGYILSLLPKWSDAEDVLQQTSIVLWQKFDQFDQDDPDSDFARWACGVARYKVLNYRKKQGRDKHQFSEQLLEIIADESLNSITNLDAERRALADCLDKLQHRSRQLVRSCYEGSNSIKEIALQLGRTPNSIYKTLNRIREQLLHCIARTLAMGDES